MNPQHDTFNISDAIIGAAGWLAAGGILTMALFPFAVPGLVLAAAAVLPLAAGAVVIGLVVALATALTMAIRGLLRHADRASHLDREVHE